LFEISISIFNFFLAHFDMDIDTEIRTKVQGKVLLYTNRDSVEPFMTMKREVTPALPDILQELSGRYSPIKSMFYFLLNFCLLFKKN